MGKKKKKKKREKVFIEGMDSYSDEYRRWKRTEIVRGLVGIFELRAEDFNGTFEEQLASAGCGLEPLFYNVEHDNSPTGEHIVSGAGCTGAVRNQYGKIQPIVFLREEVVDAGDSGESDQETSDAVRLTVLLHELGHADDIARGINYDHANLELDIVGAEAYAHTFLCRHARRRNYRLLLELYLENIERMAGMEEEAVCLAAQRVMKEMDFSEVRKWISDGRTDAGIAKLVKQSGRRKEVERFGRGGR